MSLPEIKLAPDTIFSIGNLQVTNSILATVLTSVSIIIIALLIRRNAGIRPSKGQVVFEMVRQFILDKMVISFGSMKEAKRYLPLILTIFIFLLLANQFALVPLLSNIILSNPEGTKYLFNAPAAHYSMTIGLTILVLLIAHISAILISPGKHFGSFIRLKPFFKMKSIKELPMAMINFFLGILDIIGEIAKVVSLSTRLFGNIFAGGVVVLIISSLSVVTNFLAPIPFLAISTISGLVQAFVFAMLSILYISSAVNTAKQADS
ncbi:hypothetical protein CVV38_03290 [Candidatus Peregrinibacteria bacterium HGW-Peregrinibacteria-1]|jgi:F-type H+-transporting ATPase subunit a|nr:MAG: hypothetical protein CVV38_03290 [Candidatus Peregrinibacteria bacterium HGW-Peregrinibacteria-1]